MRELAVSTALLGGVGLAGAIGLGCGSAHSTPRHSGRSVPTEQSHAASTSSRSAPAADPPARPRKATRPRRGRAAAACGQPVHEHLITHRQWLTRVQITEYYPAPEKWFVGRAVKAPGVPGRHRVDFLYSARGVSMEGDGVDLHGHHVHIHDLGSVGWVNAAGHLTRPGRCAAHWSRGIPYWRAGGWRNSSGAVTFPLAQGGWSNGVGHWRGGYGGTTFAPGQSLRLRYYHSVAVDPKLIPRGSRIYIPAYRHHGGGWFRAQDTGGAIIGRHIDVYRSPPNNPSDRGQFLTGQRVYVIPPGK